MAVIEVMNSIHAAMIAWSFILIFILILVKIFQIIGGSIDRNKEGRSGRDGSSSGDSGKGGKGGKGSGDDEDKKSKKQKELEEERKKFEENLKDPAYLKVWVRDLDDRPLQNAKVTVVPRGFKKDLKYKDHPTNKDGLAPSDGGSFTVPNNFPLDISVEYLLQKEEKYKSKEHWIKVGPLELLQKRSFTKKDTLNGLKPGENKVHDMKLEIAAEYAIGFEPFVHSVKIKGGRITAAGEVQSNTHGKKI